MTRDLELIKELGQEIGIKLTEKQETTYAAITKGGYQLDPEGRVIRLAIDSLKLETLPRTVLRFKKLDHMRKND